MPRMSASTAGDMAGMGEHSASLVVVGPHIQPRSRLPWVIAAVAVVGALGIALGVVFSRPPASQATQTQPTQTTPPPPQQDASQQAGTLNTPRSGTPDPTKPERGASSDDLALGTAGARAVGVAPAGVNYSNFMDTRLTWTFGDDDVLHQTGALIPLSPSFSIADRPQ
jgi:hypothetical protein